MICDKCGQPYPDYSKPLVFEPWRIEYPKTVFYGRKKIDLTTLQFRIFEKLFRNKVERKRHTSREELSTYLNPEEGTSSKVIDVVISSLRKKLPAGTIKTIWGYGFDLNLVPQNSTNLLGLIEQFMFEERLSARKAGLVLAHDTNLVSRLRAGGSVRESTKENILSRMEAYRKAL